MARPKTGAVRQLMWIACGQYPAAASLHQYLCEFRRAMDPSEQYEADQRLKSVKDARKKREGLSALALESLTRLRASCPFKPVGECPLLFNSALS